MSTYRPVPLQFERHLPSEMVARVESYANAMQRRRTVRHFSPEPFPIEVVTHAIRAAASAPSGANQQPWTFVLVTDAELKQRLREAAEAEEKVSWERRMSEEWLEALEPLGLDWHKPHLTEAPAIIVVFAQAAGAVRPDGRRVKHYYVDESVGIAVGMLLSALHLAGLATLTHTPSPMGFIRELLGRPTNERPYVVIPVGYPMPDAMVPDITRKPLSEVLLQR
ncbi:MAG: nitroreductase family protein [Myxococcaceae bacterium]|nr:nitroreductase family protein [Myxococcaceae bacterium]